MWFTFALAGAIIYAIRGILEKRIIHGVNPYILGFGIRLYALPFFVIPFLVSPQLWIPLDQLSLSFWLVALTIAVLLTPIETYFYYRALKYDELTLTMPILALRPIFATVLVMILLQDYPTVLGILGIFIIFFGVYSLKIKHMKNGAIEPLRQLAINPAVRMMAIVAFSQGLGDILDKIGVINANAYMYSLVNYVLLSVSLGVIAIIKARSSLHELTQNARSLFVIGLVVAGYTIFSMLALETGNPAYVSAIKSSSVLFSITFGLWILKESEKGSKILAGILMVLGLLLIRLYG
ncbi:MAG: DMT family transporter [Candidatus Saccharimonadales bacterium]